MRRFRVAGSIVLLGLLSLVTAACVTGGRSAITGVDQGTRVSPSLARGMYYEEGRLVFFGVNSGLAQFRLKDDLLPLEIAVGNKSLKRLTVGPEGITLREVGQGGRAWPMATPSETVSGNLRSQFDRNLQPVSFLEVVRLQLAGMKYIPTTFGLRPGNYEMSRTATLTSNTWTFSQVWFPNPGGELKGKLYEVWLEAPELEEPVFTVIRF